MAGCGTADLTKSLVGFEFKPMIGISSIDASVFCFTIIEGMLFWAVRMKSRLYIMGTPLISPKHVYIWI